MVANSTKAQEMMEMGGSRDYAGWINHTAKTVHRIYDSLIGLFDDGSVIVCDVDSGGSINPVSAHDHIGSLMYVANGRYYPDPDSFSGMRDECPSPIRVRMMENDCHRFKGEMPRTDVLMATDRVAVTYHPYNIKEPYRLTTTNDNGSVIFEVVTDSFAKATLYWNWEISRIHGLPISGYCHINDNQ